MEIVNTPINDSVSLIHDLIKIISKQKARQQSSGIFDAKYRAYPILHAHTALKKDKHIIFGVKPTSSTLL